MRHRPTPIAILGRIAITGLLAALVAWGAGTAVERTRLGATDEAAVARIEQELRQRFDQAAAALSTCTTQVLGHSEAVAQAARGSAGSRALFQALAAQIPPDASGRAGITLYAMNGTPVAWAGRVSDLPRDRIEGPASLFVSLDPLGPRLVRVEPLLDRSRPGSPRIATVVAEQLVEERTDVSSPVTDTFRLPTSVVDVDVRVTPGQAPPRAPYAFTIPTPEGQVLAHATVSPADLARARETWQEWIRAAVLGTLALTVLLLAAPLLEIRRHAGRPGGFALSTVGLLGVLLAGRALLGIALVEITPPDAAGTAELLPNALVLAALVWLALDSMERRRVTSPRVRLLAAGPWSTLVGIAAFLAAGAVAAWLLWWYEGLLGRIADRTPHDLLRFSLHPFEPLRLGMVSALLLLNVSVVWGAAGVLRLPAILWRTRRAPVRRPVIIASATVGALVSERWLANGSSSGMPLGPLLLAMLAGGLGAAILAHPRGSIRRASQAARLALLFLALVLPGLAFYPSLVAFSVSGKEHRVATHLAPLVASQREDLQVRRVPQALEAIDALPSLADFVTGAAQDAAPATDRAFIVWSQTELARSRTTSAVELYGWNGTLVSRFALDLPEYGSPEFRGTSCTDWEIYEEVSPFGSALRNVLRASRAICTGSRRVGGIVVRAQLDYRALPFVSSPNPYLESLSSPGAEESSFGNDVELAFYGWSRAPLYASGTRVWPLADEVFDRMVASREPFWQRVRRDDESFRVYFFNDRGGIYALGYPVLTWFSHLVNLGELVFLCAVLYAVLVAGTTLFNGVTAQTPASGRALLREVRSSFYRKLFIAFAASAGVPVVVLAIATSTYFANQFRAGVEESAVKTATVAQRLIEDYVELQQRGAGSLDRIDDEFMLLVRRAIDQDVNLFDGPRLRATSERPLFASRLLPSRTPADVYRAIALDRLPTTVMVEQLGAAGGYLVAAAPVRAGAREGIVTVPQTLRQREIEQQIDELDRRVLSAAVVFVLLGSAVGYWMAERIADPVNRLTRATRRIARGDLDARIAATSSDELRRLVEDFNRMAADLKTQRANLERTQRLEAWAEMARQVAHDIKNPLTPIQLSAEHAQRVNLDRGRPLSPVLDECVASILSQVKLLRQISSEFSSFASSPTARPEATDLAALLDEVVEPYRSGLAHRVSLVLDVAAPLPRVQIDRTLFGRALTNVIENALHAMPGGGSLQVRAFPTPGGATLPGSLAGGATVDVTDTGIGMDPEALARIFEPYFSTKATGTGLGLTIARRNVELIGGTIDVRSARGTGTTVTLILPPAA
ncbi:MAG: ATP-binding protein [Vicinamibacterales bacterium]